MSQAGATGDDAMEGIQVSIVVRDLEGAYWIGRGPSVEITASYVQAVPGHPDQAVFQLHGSEVPPEVEQELSHIRGVFGDSITVTRFDPATPAKNLILPPEA